MQWGTAGEIGLPPILDDGTENIIREWFTRKPGAPDEGYPLSIFINSNMEIYEILDGGSMNLLTVNGIISEMLEGE